MFESVSPRSKTSSAPTVIPGQRWMQRGDRALAPLNLWWHVKRASSGPTVGAPTRAPIQSSGNAVDTPRQAFPRRTWKEPYRRSPRAPAAATRRGECSAKIRSSMPFSATTPHKLPRALVVFTVMRQTAVYLQSALASQSVTAAVIDGSRASDDRVAPIGDPIVIITHAVLPAIETINAHEGVSYDLPWNPQRIEARWSSLNAYDGEAVHGDPR